MATKAVKEKDLRNVKVRGGVHDRVLNHIEKNGGKVGEFYEKAAEKELMSLSVRREIRN